MPWKILVVGMLPYDSGKTWVAIQVARSLMSRGYSTTYFKPMGASEIWRQYKAFRTSIDLGLLVLEDALKARSLLKLYEPLEAINPVAVYAAPLDIESYKWRFRDFIDDSAEVGKTGVAVRLSRCVGEEVVSAHFILADNLSRVPRVVRDEVLGSMERVHPKPVKLEGVPLADLLMSEGSEAIRSCWERLLARYEFLVVESYSNAAAPMPSVDVDLVLAVSPGKVAVYSGDRYREALEVSGGLRGYAHLSTSDVLRLLRPVAVAEYAPRAGPFEPDVKAEELDYLVEEIVRPVRAVRSGRSGPS